MSYGETSRESAGVKENKKYPNMLYVLSYHTTTLAMTLKHSINLVNTMLIIIQGISSQLSGLQIEISQHPE